MKGEEVDDGWAEGKLSTRVFRPRRRERYKKRVYSTEAAKLHIHYTYNIR